MPRALAVVDRRTHTPHVAISVHTALAWGLALGFGFFGALAAATLTRLVFYAAVAAAAVRLRRRGFSETARPLVLPGGAAIAVAVVLLCGLVISQSTWVEFVAVGMIMAAGLAIIGLRRVV
jgi:hypothetical protein